MAEFKHGFEKAKMNKDLDERLVPNGEYRDANNIQISTSEGANAGVVQNLSGNIRHATVDHTVNASYDIPTTSTCVASVAAQDKDKIYYFVCASDLDNAAGRPDICKDYILEYDTITEKTKYVFVDIWRVKTLVNVAVSSATVFKVDDDIADSPDNTTTQNRTGIRIGMHVTGGNNNYQISDNIVVTDIRYSSGWEITVNTAVSFDDNTAITFLSAPIKKQEAEGRVLNFSKNTLITGVNILDDFIYWTDNTTEPKKINIKRSIAGTGGVEYLVGGGVAGFGSATTTSTDTIFEGDTDYFHTRLVREVSSGSGLLRVITNSLGNKAVYVDESHVTVIRPAPTQPLDLEMHRVRPDKINSAGDSVATECVLNGFNWRTYAATSPDDFAENSVTRLFEVGENVRFPQVAGVDVAFPFPVDGDYIPLLLPNGFNEGDTNPGDVPAFSGAPSGVCFVVGDVLLFTKADSQEANVDESPGAFQNYDVRARVEAGPCEDADSPSLGTNSMPYVLKIESIRGSLHATDINWYVRLETQEALFEHKFPRFSYRYKYTDGEYSPFAPFSEIAFLPDKYSYEPKDGYNFGMVNQLRDLTLKYYHFDEGCIPQDLAEIDILYKETNNPAVFVVKTLKRNDVTPVWPDLTDTADGFLRGEFKVTTDMIHAAVPSNQLLRPWDNVPRYALAQEVSANRLIYGNYVQNYTVEQDPVVNLSINSTKINSSTGNYAMPSVKTLRSYQVGVVYSDRYGRETPILTGLNHDGKLPNAMTVNKPVSAKRNRLVVGLDVTTSVPSWAEYMTYYVKETSVEYYTMASDRWYEAEDGNIWLSFPSSERNKLTEESFVELKKAHGNSSAVIEPARFKILAIENEAPDEVKSSRKSLGILTNNESIGNASGFGYPTVGLNFMTILETQFDGIFPDVFDVTGGRSLVLRSGQGDVSREYLITTIVDDSAGMVKIVLEESFDQDINFTIDLAGLQVEIFEHVVENKPEFDGRFFTKIRRNHVLDSYILSQGDEDLSQLFIWGTFDIGYWNPNIYSNNPSSGLDSCLIEPGPLFDGTMLNANEFLDTTDYTTAHPTEYAGNWDGVGGQIQYFYGQTFYPSVTSDGAQTGWGYDLLTNGPSHHFVNPNHGSSEWTQYATKCKNGSDGNPFFFIDAGPAWSWTAMGVLNSGFLQALFGNENVGDRPGCEYHNDFTWATSEDSDYNDSPYVGIDMSDAGVIAALLTSDPTFLLSNFLDTPMWGDAVSSANDVPNIQEGNSAEYHGGNMIGRQNEGDDKFGQPSRGIWNGGLCMDLSWTGMGVGATDFGGDGFVNNGDIAHRLSEHELDSGMGAAHKQAWFFMQKLTEPATLFRFKRDPRDLSFNEDSLYTTTTFFGATDVSYDNTDVWAAGTNLQDGAWGIRNYATKGFDADEKQYVGNNMRQRWTITVNSPIGEDTDFGYSPIKGTNPTFAGTDFTANARRALHHDVWVPPTNNPENHFDTIEIYERIDLFATDRSHFSTNPAAWETIPKESVDLDIYYQASGLIPLELNHRTNEEYIPIGSTISNQLNFGLNTYYTVKSWSTHNQIQLTSNLATALPAESVIRIHKRNGYECTAVVSTAAAAGQAYITLHGDVSTNNPSSRIYTQEQTLNWNNCWSFGNGVESDRIRDDYNAAQIDNGVKVSSGVGRQVKEERRKHGLIWSGIYNSNTGVNDTNQFIMADSITKDLNPVYGSIQALLNRNTRLIMFCEDKILRAVTNRDALYNADGKPQLVASNAVIGDVQAYQGNFGIATNPESMVENPYAVYFSDAMRGKVLRLTNDGIVPISDAGMKDYFADLMKENVWRNLGTYDQRKNEYNLTVSKKYTNTQIIPHEQKTISFSEPAKGWVSFKDFIPQHGTSINNNYYTFYDGQLYKHHDETEITYYSSSASSANLTMFTVVGLEAGMLAEGVGIVEGSIISSISGNVVTINNNVTSLFIAQDIKFSTPHNTFYGTYYDSDVTLVFNDQKSSVKSFGTIKYEGSQARIDEWDSVSGNLFTNVYGTNDGLASANIDDEEYYNLDPKNGWYIDNILTDLQSCGNIFFKNKEGKYYGYPTGETTVLSNLDEKEFSVQGLGNATMQHDTSGYGGEVTVRVTNNTSSTYQGSDGSGGAWDSASVIADETSKWQCTIGSKDVIGGAAIGSSGETLTFELSPIVNGVYSGTPVAAENLEWAGGADGDADYVWIDDESAGGDPDDDDTIYSVGFTNNGVAGDPSNTVTVTVTFKNGDTYPTSDVLWYIDIDEKTTHVDDTDPERRDVAFEVHWSHYSTADLVDVVPDTITVPSITNTLVLAGVDPPVSGQSTSFEQWKFIGNDAIDADTSYLVYSDTFTVATGGATANHFTNISYVKENMGVYEDQYEVVIDENYDSTTGLVTSLDAKVYYTSSSDLPDPPNNGLYNLGHRIRIIFVLKPHFQGITDTITDVVHQNSIGPYGGPVRVLVYGNSGAKYNINIQEKESVSSDATIASGYYTHETAVFGSTLDVTEFTIPTSGFKRHYINIPAIDPTSKTVDVRYDITVVAAGTTSLASGVPTIAGDSKVLQWGWRSITISPTTFNTALYGSLTSLSETKYFPAQPIKNTIPNIISMVGGNGNVNNNPIKLVKANPNIKIGMRVVSETYDIVGVDGASRLTGGIGTQPVITHGTTVTKIDGQYIDLSTSHAVPDGTSISFIQPNKAIIPFEFRIQPNSNNLTLTNAVVLSDQISLQRGVSILTAAASSGRTITLDDIKGIRVGDVVHGFDSKSLIRVATLASTTSITVDNNVSVADNTRLTFTSPNLNDVALINASKFWIDPDVYIRGHIQVNELTDNVTIPVLLDNIITAS